MKFGNASGEHWNKWHEYCNCRTIFMVKLWRRYISKLRIIILLHFELVTFRFAYGRTLNLLISLISGFFDVSLSPETNIVHFLRHQNTSNNSRQFPTHSSEYIFWKSLIFGSHQIGKCWKRQVPTNHEDPS